MISRSSRPAWRAAAASGLRSAAGSASRARLAAQNRPSLRLPGGWAATHAAKRPIPSSAGWRCAGRCCSREGGARYRHAVVDEAQDLSPAHWMLLRAMVAPGPNDLFIAGDTHQRIYDNYVSLASLGINIRGRSSRLTLSYRSTHEILSAAEALLGTEQWDDLDGGTDTLAGYRSVLRGPRPSLHGYATWADEVAGIVTQVKEWLPADGTPSSVGVAVPENRLVEDVLKALDEARIEAAAIGRDGPRKPGVVHIGTLHRFKGLEYQRMLIADASAGSIPSAKVIALRAEYPERYDRQLKQARSLLFVAATRARDVLAITWHGSPCPFLPQALAWVAS
jgi:superfamily I DNA/RNA helicase